MAPYLASSVHIVGFVNAAQQLELMEKVLPLLTDETRHTLENPYEAKWVPARIIQDLTLRIAQVHGPEILDPLNFLMTKDSMGKMVLPMLRVALAITGRSPASVFARVGESVKVAMQGVDATWAAKNDTSGRITLRYVEAPPQVVHHAWKGVFRFAFELTDREGQLDSHRYLDAGLTLELDVSWL